MTCSLLPCFESRTSWCCMLSLTSEAYYDKLEFLPSTVRIVYFDTSNSGYGQEHKPCIAYDQCTSEETMQTSTLCELVAVWKDCSQVNWQTIWFTGFVITKCCEDTMQRSKQGTVAAIALWW